MVLNYVVCYIGGGGLEILQRGTFLPGKGNLRNSDFNQLKSKLT